MRTHWRTSSVRKTGAPTSGGQDIKTAIVEGKGDIAAEERPTLTIGPNRRGRDRVLFEADEEHWHGAAPNRLMLHLPINEGDADHDFVHGLDCVTDKEYAARPPLS